MFNGFSIFLFSVDVAIHRKCMGLRRYFLDFLDDICFRLLRDRCFSSNKRSVSGYEFQSFTNEYDFVCLFIRNSLSFFILGFLELWEATVFSFKRKYYFSRLRADLSKRSGWP